MRQATLVTGLFLLVPSIASNAQIEQPVPQFDSGSVLLSARPEAMADDDVATGLDENITYPFNTTSSASSGGITSNAEYTLQSNLIRFDYDFSRATDGSAFIDGSIDFVATSNEAFEISGLHSLGTTSGNQRFRLNVSLFDGSTNLFSTIQESNDVAAGSHILGQGGGNSRNVLTGSTTGNLVAGTLYQLNFDASLNTSLSNSGGGESSGFIQIAFVPEPSSLAILSLGGLLVIRRRHNK